MSEEIRVTKGVQVRLEKFQGPLDLLLHLIQRDEIDIRDIPVAHVTQQFLHYLEMMRLLDLEISGEFLVMAASLMRIKARMLLPIDGPLDEDELDPRDELVRRLIEYKQFKEAAGTLKEKEEERSLLYERGQTPVDVDAGPLPLRPVNLFDLLDALDRVLTRLPEKNVVEMEREMHHIEDKMALIAGQVREAKRLAFEAIVAECKSRMEVIVSFLALLELLKMGRVLAVQEDPFGEIWLEAPEEDPLFAADAESEWGSPEEEEGSATPAAEGGEDRGSG